jgi:hypothetical protein
VRLAVLPEYQPTLPQLLAPLPRWVARAVLAVALLAAALIAWALLAAGAGEETVVRRGPVAFNFIVPDGLRMVEPRAGELLRYEKRNRGLFIQSFAVSSVALPPYRGDSGGLLPVFADSEIARLARSLRDFELVQEGKARVNEIAGYQIVYRARLAERRLYGRLVLLPEPRAGARTGVRLHMESTPAAGVGRAEDVGVRGLNKRPFRSFRFGTERP